MLATLIDTCVWLSFVNERESRDHREDTDTIYELIDQHNIVIPWPIGYETVRTRLARNKIALSKFETELKSSRIVWIDDAPYRQKALELAFDSSIRNYRPLSMADCLIRLILDDIAVKIDYLATWNTVDFEDVCRNRRVEIIPG